jgi:hypothetical protein
MQVRGLLVQREVHVAAFILLTLLDFYQRVANCHGVRFYLSSGKPMGLLSGTSPSDRLRPHQDQEAMASRCQSAVSALPRKIYCIVESLEFGQLEMATSLYPCRMCVIDKRLCELILWIVFPEIYQYSRTCCLINSMKVPQNRDLWPNHSESSDLTCVGFNENLSSRVFLQKICLN